MKKEEKIALLEECRSKMEIARVFFKYDQSYDYIYYYVHKVNGKFLLAQEENDFQLNGFHLRKTDHITMVEIKDDLCAEINRWNGVAAQVHDPGIDISSWQSVFEGLRNHPGFLIIEDEINVQLAVGEIAEVKRGRLLFRQFDADGVWQEDPLDIPYASITHVAWDTRYTNNWYNYMNRDKRSIHP